MKKNNQYKKKKTNQCKHNNKPMKMFNYYK